MYVKVIMQWRLSFFFFLIEKDSNNEIEDSARNQSDMPVFDEECEHLLCENSSSVDSLWLLETKLYLGRQHLGRGNW
jgi:hypothetical protein